MKTNIINISVMAGSLLVNSGCKIAYESTQDLEPEVGVLANYNLYSCAIHSVFERGYDEDVVFRMVCVPGFTPEWLVGVRETNGTYSAFVLRPQKHIEKAFEKYNHEATDFSKTIGVTEKTAVIDEEVVKLLVDAWSRMLYSVHASKKSSVYYLSDSMNYHFSMRLPKRGEASGMIYENRLTTKTELLSSLGYQIAAYVEASPEKRQAIIKEITDTAKLLQKQP